MSNLKLEIKQLSKELGFELFGVCSPFESIDFEFYKKWLKNYCSENLPYLHKNLEEKFDLTKIFPEVKSVLVFAINFKNDFYEKNKDLAYEISSYALAKDYHKVLRKKLKEIVKFLNKKENSTQRIFVDSNYLFEKFYATKAGLGCQGKNSLLVNKDYGCSLFLGIILTSLDIPKDLPFEENLCLNCNECVKKCPTKAINGNYVLNTNLCLNTFLIETKQASFNDFIDSKIGNKIFGCQECLKACPYYKNANLTKEEKFSNIKSLPSLARLASWTKEEFENRFLGTPLTRVGFLAIKKRAEKMLEKKG